MGVEIWKDINGYDGSYQISNKGRIRSLTRKITDILGRPRTIFGRLISLNNLPNGYVGVNLSKNDHKETKLLHRLIAEAFIPNPHNFPIINHKNHIRNDNRLDNLEWCTQSENLLHSSINGRHVGSSKFNNADVVNIFEMYARRLSQLEIAKKYNVSDSTISGILKRKTYKCVQIKKEILEKCNTIREERYSNYFKGGNNNEN